MFEREIIRTAKKNGLFSDVGGFRKSDGCIAVINQNTITAVPYKETYLSKADPEFFLLTTYWELGLLFYKHYGKPAWICEDISDLRDICPPMEAGMKWAYILTECENSWDACIYAEHLCINGRVVSVLGGTCCDLIRTFFPEEWQRLECEL